MATNEKHYIQAIHYSGSDTDAKNKLLGIFKKWDRTEIITTTENYIRVEFTSLIF
jgi:uncharacterized protein (DUF1499 family)